MQLATAHTHVSTVEEGEGQGVLQQTGQWRRQVVVAVDADHAHQVGDDPDGAFRAEYLCLQG
ncbi:hypothetical protein D3C78_1921010 [compost metagenome]